MRPFLIRSEKRSRSTTSCSYTLLVLQGKIYIHAGCPTTGRLSSLYSFDVPTRTWKLLASAPEPGRGGTVLAVADLPGTGPVLLRYGGIMFPLNETV